MEDKISELKDELSIVETEIKWRGHKCTSCGKKTSRAQYTAMGTFVNNVITCSHGYYGSNEIMGYNNTYSASGSPGGESCPYFRDMYEKRERLKEEIEELNSTIIYAPREEETENETAKPKKAISVNTTAEALTERGFIFLEDSEWETAKDYFDNALDINPKYGQAYIGLLCAELKIKSESKIKKLKEPLDNNPNYQKALRFSDTQYKAQITSYNQAIHDGIKEKQYKELVNAKMLVKTKSKSLHELEYQYLAQQFRAMDGYKDTLTLSEECDEQYRTMKETREKVQLEEIRKMEEETRKKEEQTRKKYRVLWERLSDEGKARAGERRKAAQAKLDEENEKAKAAHEAEYQRSVNEYQLNHEKWQATVANIKAEQEAKL
ncbi:MAG: hypothetical protein LBC96_05955, partial [Lachnospiraceae bacterium]|nr:hypothetical protein [Lachnospiraceae bacterium]